MHGVRAQDEGFVGLVRRVWRLHVIDNRPASQPPVDHDFCRVEIHFFSGCIQGLSGVYARFICSREEILCGVYAWFICSQEESCLDLVRRVRRLHVLDYRPASEPPVRVWF